MRVTQAPAAMTARGRQACLPRPLLLRVTSQHAPFYTTRAENEVRVAGVHFGHKKKMSTKRGIRSLCALQGQEQCMHGPPRNALPPFFSSVLLFHISDTLHLGLFSFVASRRDTRPRPVRRHEHAAPSVKSDLGQRRLSLSVGASSPAVCFLYELLYMNSCM